MREDGLQPLLMALQPQHADIRCTSPRSFPDAVGVSAVLARGPGAESQGGDRLLPAGVS